MADTGISDKQTDVTNEGDESEFFESSESTQSSQPTSSQPSTQDDPVLEQLYEDASLYGISRDSLQGIPAEAIERLMTDLDRQHAGASGFPSNGWGNQFAQTPQQFQQPGFPQQHQQQQMQQPVEAPNWDDEEIFDEHSSKAFKYLNHQVQQMHNMFAQQQAQEAVRNFFREVSSLDESFGTDINAMTPTQWEKFHAVIAMRDQLRMKHPNASEHQLVRRTLRSMNPMENPELKKQAVARQSQFAGKPARSNSGRFQSAEQIVQSKLAEYASSQADGFL